MLFSYTRMLKAGARKLIKSLDKSVIALRNRRGKLHAKLFAVTEELEESKRIRNSLKNIFPG